MQPAEGAGYRASVGCGAEGVTIFGNFIMYSAHALSNVPTDASLATALKVSTPVLTRCLEVKTDRFQREKKAGLRRSRHRVREYNAAMQSLSEF